MIPKVPKCPLHILNQILTCHNLWFWQVFF
jgi:hypothetical protein